LGRNCPEVVGLSRNKNHFCGVKCILMVIFASYILSDNVTPFHMLRYDTVAQTTELSQHVKQCMLATVKRHELVLWTLHFFKFLNSTLFRFDSTFWLDSTLKL